MDLNTSIEELKLALQNSDAFCRYQKIREEVHHYPEKEHRLHEFRRKNYFLQNSKDQIDLFTEADRLEQEYKTGQAELSPIYAEVKKLWQIKYKVEQVVRAQENPEQSRRKQHQIDH